MNKIAPIIAIAVAFLAPALSHAKATHHCKVVSLPTTDSAFLMFPTLPPTPQMDDEIDLDLDSAKIEDLTFASGNAIALKQVGASLLRQSPTTGSSTIRYKGEYRSPTGDYTGVMYFNGDPGTVYGAIEIVRLAFEGGFSLAQYGLECERVSP